MEKEWTCANFPSSPQNQHDQIGQAGDRGIVTFGTSESLLLLFPLGAYG